MATSLRVDVSSPGRGGFVPGMPDGAGFSAAVQHTQRPGGDDGLLVLIQSRGLRGTAGPRPMPGGGMAEVSPVEELRLFRFNRALGIIRKHEPTNREATFMAAPNQPPSEDWVRKLEAEASAVLQRQRAGPGASLPATPMTPAEQARLGALAAASPGPATLPAGPPGFLQFHDWDAAKSGVRADGTPYATFRGTVRELSGWHTEPLQYAKRDPAETKIMRQQFDSYGRADFCEYLALQHRPELEAAGLTSAQIETLNMGGVPRGYQVHHIHPLDGGGTNGFGNLILMRIEPEHQTVSSYQAAVKAGMQPGDTKVVQWPVPPAGSLVWPPRPGVGQPQ